MSGLFILQNVSNVRFEERYVGQEELGNLLAELKDIGLVQLGQIGRQSLAESNDVVD
jgi:hypothetical protein